jgi:hypothetical protein
MGHKLGLAICSSSPKLASLDQYLLCVCAPISVEARRREGPTTLQKVVRLVGAAGVGTDDGNE